MRYNFISLNFWLLEIRTSNSICILEGWAKARISRNKIALLHLLSEILPKISDTLRDVSMLTTVEDKSGYTVMCCRSHELQREPSTC